MNKKTASPWLTALAASLFSAGALFAAEAGGEVLGNADIVELYRARVSESTIIAKINSTPSRFDLSTTSIIALQANGVSDMVINAMMTASTRTPPPPRLDEARYRSELANIATGANSAKVEALAWIQSNRSLVLPPLRQDLADRRPEIRRAALVALGHLRDTESLPEMRTLIADPSADVRRAAAEVLAGMNDAQAIAAAETALSRSPTPLDGYVRLIGYVKLTRAAGALGQILSTNGDATTRAAAAWALGEIGRPGLDGRPALEKALDADPDPSVRREAALALANYHDPRTAQLLEDACRKDYEVRDVTLAALAEYPEAVEFLVGVMNLGADQIAVNELETARASLGRLTGQDFGLDGGRWSQWFAANRSRYPSAAGSVATTTAMPAAPASSASVSAKPQVDIEAWSIVADASEIPMAPQVEAITPKTPGLPGIPSLPVASNAGPSQPAGADKPLNYTPIPNPGNLPAAPSPRDFDAVTPDLTGIMGPPAPSTLPSTDLTTGAIEEPEDTASSGPRFQAWSSDPKRVKTGSDMDDDDEEYAGRGGSDARAGGGLSPSGTEDFSDMFGPSAGMASAPRQPTPRVVSPLPTDEPASGSQEMRGIALMLPGMENMADAPPARAAESPALTGPTTDASGLSLTPPGGQGPSTFTAPPSFLSGEDDDAFPAASVRPETTAASASPAAPSGSSAFESLGASGGSTDSWEDSLPGFDTDAPAMTTYVDSFADDTPPATPDLPAASTASVLPAEPTVTIYPSATGDTASGGAAGDAPMLLLGVGDSAPAPAASGSPVTAPALTVEGTDEIPGFAVTTEEPGAFTATSDSSFLPVHDQGSGFETASGGEAPTAIVTQTLDEHAESPASTVTVTEEMPAMPGSEAVVVTETSGSSLFVEPEPGQLVVGEILITPGTYSESPAVPATAVDPQPYVYEGDATPPVQAETPPPAPTPAPTVVATPAPEPAPVVQDTRSKAEIYFEATRSGQAYIPQEMYPPTPPVPEGGTAESTPEYPSTADYFADPSAPRPPVRPEGTVTPSKGKEMPPMLGEGLFTK